MLTSKSRYALRALAALANNAHRASASAQELAEVISAPRKFLEAILTDLRKAGILVSSRGTSGGYHLSLSPEGISVASVVEKIDGPFIPLACSVASFECKDCPAPSSCSMRRLMGEVRLAVTELLERHTISDLAADGAGAWLPPIHHVAEITSISKKGITS